MRIYVYAWCRTLDENAPRAMQQRQWHLSRRQYSNNMYNVCLNMDTCNVYIIIIFIILKITKRSVENT